MKMMVALVVASALAAPSLAAPCKDAKGKFTKCPTTTSSPSAAGITKDKGGKCHIASGAKKGQFTACPK